jgi:hypothetical protein
MKLRPATVPTLEEMARHLGLCDLHIGRHFLRDAAGERTGSVWVSSLWSAEVVPSFQPRIALALVSGSTEPAEVGSTPNFIKAVMALPEATAATSLETDPMRNALSGVDLYCGDSNPPALNGIAYTLAFQTMHLQGSLQFGNPSHPCLRSLEEALLQVAQRVAVQSGDANLVAAVDGWREFVQGKA